VRSTALPSGIAAAARDPAVVGQAADGEIDADSTAATGDCPFVQDVSRGDAGDEAYGAIRRMARWRRRMIRSGLT